jgi:hypothetical protein
MKIKFHSDLLQDDYYEIIHTTPNLKIRKGVEINKKKNETYFSLILCEGTTDMIGCNYDTEEERDHDHDLLMSLLTGMGIGKSKV